VNALAILLLSVVPANDRASMVDEISKAVVQLKEGDSKMKAMYNDVAQGYKKVGPTITRIKEINHDLAVLKTQLVNVVGVGYDYDVARDSLNDRIRSLERQKAKLEDEVKSKKGSLEDQERAFKEEEAKAWEAAGKSLTPLLAELRIDDDRKALDAVMSIFDLFIFDDHKDVPTAPGGSVLDQPLLTAVGKCLATSGTKQITRLKKALERTVAMKYAAVIAVTEIGPDAVKADKEVLSLLHELNTTLIKNKTLTSAERDARRRMVQKAIDAMRP